MNTIETIRAEIERRMEAYNRSIDKYFDKKKSVQAERDSWKWAECKSILAFLDTLPEQPVTTITKSNALFDKCVENCDPAVMKEVSDNVDKMLASDGLEEEIKRYGKEEMPVVLESDLNDIARHFYELGQQNCPKISDNSLDEEINKKLGHDDWLEVVFDRKTLIDFAGHFYALGLNARKDE